jgi:hypothetical protein
MTTQIIARSSIVVTVIAYTRYIRGIIQWRNKPHAFSWLIRWIMTGTAFFAQRTQTDSIATWVLWLSAVVSFVVAIFARSKYKSVIAKIDRLYFGLSIIALLLRYVTKTPVWSVILIVLTDLLAFLPTFRKTRHDPKGESVFVYALSSIKFVLVLRSLDVITITTALYPIYLILANGIFTIFTLVRRWQKN